MKELYFCRSDAHIIKVTIPRTEILSIKEQLSVAGVDEVTIFPDLDGLCGQCGRDLERDGKNE
jgi:hypothetical protein